MTVDATKDNIVDVDREVLRQMNYLVSNIVYLWIYLQHIYFGILILHNALYYYS